MKISSEPEQIGELLRFLRQMGYAVGEVAPGVVEVERRAEPDSPGVSAIALALQLRVWNEVNGGDARIVDTGGSFDH
jgi:hypothetical protein